MWSNHHSVGYGGKILDLYGTLQPQMLAQDPRSTLSRWITSSRLRTPESQTSNFFLVEAKAGGAEILYKFCIRQFAATPNNGCLTSFYAGNHCTSSPSSLTYAHNDHRATYSRSPNHHHCIRYSGESRGSTYAPSRDGVGTRDWTASVVRATGT